MNSLKQEDTTVYSCIGSLDWIVTVFFLGWLSYVNRKDIFALFVRFMPYNWVKKICSNHNLVNWSLRNVKYKTDQELYGNEDYHVLPEEFWKNKAGDCEDYAIFSNDILKSHKYNSKMYVHELTNNTWHAITIATLNNKTYYIFDLGNLIDMEGDTFENIIKRYTGRDECIEFMG